MKWALYNILFALVYPFLLPGFLIRMLRRGGYAARMGDRFALYPEMITARFRPPADAPKGALDKSGHPCPPKSDFVWIHAVSVGEVQVAGQLMRAWRAADPSVRFCFSTTSSTGWKMAEREVEVRGGDEGGGGDILIYNPLDFPSFVKSALKLVRPRAIVLTESEIWPNFIRKAKSYDIPVFLVNARVSDRSAPRYEFARFLFKDVFGCFTRIFAQSDLDKARLVAAGAPAERIDVTGSFKFDVAKRNEAKERELWEWIGEKVEVRGGGKCLKILLGGSTWPGEDEALLKIYRKLLEEHQTDGDKPLLVIAPRHFEKADQVEANIRAAGFDCVRRTAFATSQTPQTSQTSPPVFLCDTTGEMMGLFGICAVAFVGKSLCAHGSQNMIEPCLCGKPTVVGPYTENFRPVMSDLLAAQAIVQVADADALEREIVRLMTDDAAARALGDRALAAVLGRQGVVPRCVTTIQESLGEGAR